MAVLAASAPGVPYSSTCTEWSITSSDAFGVAPQAHDGIAHGREVHHTRHAGEVLQNDACGGEGDLVGRGRLRIPLEQRLDVAAGDAHAVLEAQQILEENLQRVGQARELVLRQRRETPDLVRAIAGCEGRARAEAVGHACLRVCTQLYRARRPPAAPAPSGRGSLAHRRRDVFDDRAAETAFALVGDRVLTGRD